MPSAPHRAGDVLCRTGFPARARRLRIEGTDASVAEAFRTRAEEELRKRPREAEELCRLGARVANELEALRLPSLVHLERYDEAREAGEHALEGFLEGRDLGGVVRTRMALADLEYRTDRPRAALLHYTLLERILPETTPATLRGAIASNRANSLEACHRFRAATRQFELARSIFESGGHDHTVAQVDYNFAYSEMLRGRYGDALRRLSATEETFRRLGDERHLAHIHLDRSEILILLNRPEEARKDAVAARESFASQGLRKEAARCAADRAAGTPRDTAAPLSTASLDLLRARPHLSDGDAEGAAERAERVLSVCARIHAPWARMDGAWVLATILLEPVADRLNGQRIRFGTKMA